VGLVVGVVVGVVVGLGVAGVVVGGLSRSSGGGLGGRNSGLSGRSSSGSSGRLGGSRGSGRSRGGRRGTSLVDSRTRNRVRSDTLVDAEQHSGVSVLVVSWESDTRGIDIAITRNGKLYTSYVWLHTIEGIGTMVSKDLTTEQVVSGSNIRRNSDVNTTSAFKQSINTPFAIHQTILIDFEPNITRTSFGFGQVEDDRTLVSSVNDVIRWRVGIVVPLDSEFRASGNGTLAIGSLVCLR
jgi:hypothetical protein